MFSQIKVGRLGQMHSSKMEDIKEAFAGDIVALFGVDCASGDTFVSSPKAKIGMVSCWYDVAWETYRNQPNY